MANVKPWEPAAVAARTAKAAEKRERAVQLHREGVKPGVIAWKLGFPRRTVTRYLQGCR